MGAFIAKQPNGLYCRFSSVVGTITDYNMTEKDYIKLCQVRYGKESGEKEAKDVLKNYLRPFREVLESFVPNNESVENFSMRLKEMGYIDKFKFDE